MKFKQDLKTFLLSKSNWGAFVVFCADVYVNGLNPTNVGLLMTAWGFRDALHRV